MRLAGYALAPKEMIENRKPVLYMYRETPDSVQDSGWRFFSGEETDEYVNIPENIGLYDILTIIHIYPYIEPYLSLPTGSVLERESQICQFRKVE